MQRRRINLFLPGLILIVALPGLASMTYFKITGDPNFRPLGVPLMARPEYTGEIFENGITVQINWGATAKTRNTRAYVKKTLQDAMSIYGIDTRVLLSEVPGDTVAIYFVIGTSLIGPYRLSNVTAGIPAALSAHKLWLRVNPQD